MYFLLNVGIITSACAAPHYGSWSSHHQGHHGHHGRHHHNHSVDGDHFSKFCNSSTSSDAIEGNEYIIRIPLQGYEEKDITVKVREGLLLVQTHKGAGGSETNLAEKVLPNTINVNGIWTYNRNALRVVFPFKEGVQTHNVEVIGPTPPVTEENDIDVRIVNPKKPAN